MNTFRHFLLITSLALTACTAHNNSVQQNSSQAVAPSGQQSTTQPLDSSTVPASTNQKVSTVEEKKQALNQSARQTPTSWELSGAMAIRNKNKAWSVSLNWVQRGATGYQIRMIGPLGSGTILIARQGSLVSFKDGAKTASSSNAEELLARQTGMRLPVNNLYYWVRGIPAPGAVQSAKRNAANQLVSLQQSGFTIEYLGYNQSGLPNVIRLQGNGVFIKLVVKSWRA